MPSIAANNFYTDENGDTLRIVSVDGDVITVEQRRTGDQRILAQSEVAAKIEAGHWASLGAFGPDAANWPGANK
jgi:hypothetical protein